MKLNIARALAPVRRLSNRGQAAIEMAIFGAAVMMVLAAMINYGQTLAAQQELEMYAFRRALQLSRARLNDGEAARQAGITVFKEVYPVSLGDTGLDRQKVSGSASIDWESDSGTLTGEDPQDFSSHYWQYGRRMIRDKQLIELPKMKLTRKKDKDTDIRSFIDYVFEFVTGDSDDDITVWQSAPIEQTTVNNLKGLLAQEAVRESAGVVANTSSATAQENNNTTIHMQDEDKIKAWDNLVISIDGTHGIPGAISMQESETITKNKEWNTQQN